MADIDHFKQINDQHGHAMDDTALREVADAMRAALRSFELLYRTGGDEFLLLLPDFDTNESVQVAERLRSAVEQLHIAELDLTCSFGVATARGDAVDLTKLVAVADAALYEAKHHGRNQVKQHATVPPVPPETRLPIAVT